MTENLAKKNPKYLCEICDYNTSRKSNYEKHLQTDKHFEKKIASQEAKLLPREAKYFCEVCYYSTQRKADFTKHCETLKCKSVTKSQKVTKVTEKSHSVVPFVGEHISSNSFVSCEIIDSIYSCVCSKDFKTHSGLWRHQKRCDMCIPPNDNKLMEIVISNQKQHDDTIVKLVEMVKDLSKDKSIINNINNTNTNCNNKQFNLNFFLNETCKDAYNISEFVEQLDVSMEDMLNTSRVGYTQGVSQIIVNGLKALDETKRPIHCTDVKRETLYIKENDEWTKEEEDRPILLGAIKKIAGKNIKQISEWCKQHPNYRDSSSRDNDIHLKMLVNVMQGGTDNEINNSFKTIFRNVATGSRIHKR